jgi:hypothetical protein
MQIQTSCPGVILIKTYFMKTLGYTKPTQLKFLNNSNHIRFPILLMLLFFISGIKAQTTISAWNFNASNTAPSTGVGSASIYGSLNQTFPTSTYGKCWQLTNFANQSSQSGTRGVGFNVSTVGFTNIQVNFEQRSSGPASRWTQLDYSIDGGANWILAFWNNNGAILPKDSWVAFSVDFTNVIGVSNNANFKVRIVSVFCPLAFDETTNTAPFSANSAYMITDAGAVYAPGSSTNNATYSATGSWRFDNISFIGFSTPVINAISLNSSMAAVYGSPSNAIPITIAASNLIAGISATPALGFELSTNSSNGFASSPLLNLTNGSVIYVRTIFNKSVGTFNAVPCVLLQSNWAVNKNITTKSTGNEITTKPLSITAEDVYKEMGQILVSGAGNTAFTAIGLISGDTISSVNVTYGLAGEGTGVGSIVGEYLNQVNITLPIGVGFSAANYLVTSVGGSIFVTGFTPGNIIVNRIGDGNSPLGSTTYPLNLLEYLPTGSPFQTLNQQFSNANLLTETGEQVASNGHLNSSNEFIGIPGYDAVPGTPNVSISQPKVTNILGIGASVNGRVVFPITGGAIPFVEGFLTSLLPLNATTFYAAGTGINYSGGIWYYTGSNFIQLNSEFNAIRTIEEYNGNLYFSTDSYPGGIYQLGTGLPTTSGQVATLVISTTSPKGFAISPDGNTAYLADDSPINGNDGGGIQKWIKQNGAWSKQYTHAYRVKGLTVDFSDSIAQIYGTTCLSSPGSDNNKIIKISDVSPGVTPIDLAIAGTNYLYKGLDFSPANPPSVPQITHVDQPTCTIASGKVHFSDLPSGQWRITGFPQGSKTGTGSTAILEGLSPGQSYTFKVTSYTGRTSPLTTEVVLNAQPESPTVPTGASIQKRCQGALISDLSLNQSNVLWYAAVNTTLVISTATPIAHNTHYFASQLNGNGCESGVRIDVLAKLVNHGDWKGENEGSWKTNTNWCGGVPVYGSSVNIPAATTIHLDTMANVNELNIESTGVLVVSESEKLTTFGDIILNGELKLKHNATLVQQDNSGWLGNGNVHLQQAITGTGGATPNGRYWFVGSPMANSVSHDYKAETSALLKFFNEPTGAWVEINNASTPIQIGKGYFVQTGSMDTIDFSGAQLNNGNYTFPLTRTGTTNFYRGFNLVSNPYPSYVDFDAVTKSNILPTMWYRTSDVAQTMIFDTYNSELGIGTSLGGFAVTKFIPPMQSFWVKIPSGFTTGSIGFSNAMRSHYVSGFEGLKSSAQNFPVYIRFNLEDGLKKDQMILLMDQHLSATVDEFDSEKMIVSGYPQLFTNVGSTKLVINSLPYSKSKVSVPITLDLPTSKSYIFQTEEIHVEDGLVLLEDRQEQIYQDLSINPCYGFYSNSGVISDRFVLHLNLPNGVHSSMSLSSTFLTNNDQNPSPFDIYETDDQEIQISLQDTMIGSCSMQIFDASGRLVKSISIIDAKTKINLTQGAGVYFIQLERNQQIFRKKIILTQK